MAQYLSDQIWTYTQGPTSLGGIAGAPVQVRGAEYRGRVQWQHYTLSNTGATTPSASLGGVALALGDTIIVGQLKPTDRFIGGKIFTTAGGATATVSVGKQDTNNAANTDPAHYLAATAMSATTTANDYNLNIGEQVGADPTGSSSDVGNKIPNFGSGPVNITLTFAGAAPAAATVINGYFLYSVE